MREGIQYAERISCQDERREQITESRNCLPGRDNIPEEHRDDESCLYHSYVIFSFKGAKENAARKT
jgi:hypothetical protein